MDGKIPKHIVIGKKQKRKRGERKGRDIEQKKKKRKKEKERKKGKKNTVLFLPLNELASHVPAGVMFIWAV